MIYLFTTPGCLNCPPAKKLLEAEHIPAIMVDASRPEGLLHARKFKVSQVPCIVMTNNEGGEVKRFSGIEDIRTHYSALHV